MAQPEQGIFGFLRGKVGNLVGRMRYGKFYISRRPTIYKANQTEAARLNRKKFSRRQRFKKELRKDKRIRDFWRVVDAEGLNDNTKLMIRNTPFVTYERILPGAGFTPKSEDKIDVRNIRFQDRNMDFEFKLNRANPKILEPPYDLYAIAIVDRLFELTNEYVLRRKLIAGSLVTMRIENEPTDSYQTVSLYYDEIFCQEICDAEKAYAMVAAIKFNELKNKYEWTDTYFEELFDFVPENIKFDAKGLPFRYND